MSLPRSQVPGKNVLMKRLSVKVFYLKRLAATMFALINEMKFKDKCSMFKTCLGPNYIDGLEQDCSNSIANALKLLQSCTKR